MFDLFRNREKATRYLLTAVLSAVALSMVITLIPGITNPAAPTDDQTLAKVCNSSVTTQDVRRQIDSFTSGGQLPQSMVGTYLPQIIDSQIELQALACVAEEKGLELSDADMANEIRNSMPSLVNASGEFDRNAYESGLARMGLTIPLFEERLKQQLLVKRMQDLATEGLIVPANQVRAEFDRRNVKLKIQYIVVSPAAFQSEIHPTEAELQDTFKKANYRVPEKRQSTVLYADEEKIGSSLSVSDDSLKAAYMKDQDRWRVPEAIKVRHILILTQGKSEAEKAVLLKKAQEVLAKAKAGEDFAKLAKQYSEDPGSKDKGGEYDWMPRGQFVKEFEAAAYALKPNEISNIVTTEYGYHIIQLIGHQEAHLKSLEEARPTLMQEEMKTQIQAAMQKAIDGARAEAVKSPGNLEEIAKKFNLTSYKTGMLQASEPLPIFGRAADFSNAIFALKRGDFTSVVQPQPGKLAFAHVDGIEAARPATFDEKRADVQAILIRQKSSELAKARATEAEAKAAAGADLKDLAKSLGTDLKTTGEIGRDSAIEGLGDANSFSDLFSKPQGSLTGPVEVMGQWVIAKSLERSGAPEAQFEKERETIITNLKKKMANDRYMLFKDSVLQHLLDEGKVKRNQTAITRMLNAYRS